MLTLRYRPRSFSDIVGQRNVTPILQRMVQTGSIPNAMVFSGTRGSGKTSAARVFSAALTCEHYPESPCGQCPQCVSVQLCNSLSAAEIDAASHSGVADIRRLTEEASYTTTGGRWRVTMLDEAQALSKEAFSALLKALEEPPPNLVWILLTTEPNKIIDTVLSRCMTFSFNRISEADIVARLRYIRDAERIDVEDAVLVAISQRSDGGLRDAIMSFDQIARMGLTTEAEFLAHLGESDFAPEVIEAMSSGDHAQVFELLNGQWSRHGDVHTISGALTKCLRDILVLQANGTLELPSGAVAARHQLAALSPRAVVKAMSVLWQLSSTLSVSSDPRSVFDLAVVMMMDVLHPTLDAAVVSNGQKPLSADDVRALFATNK